MSIRLSQRLLTAWRALVHPGQYVSRSDYEALRREALKLKKTNYRLRQTIGVQRSMVQATSQIDQWQTATFWTYIKALDGAIEEQVTQHTLELQEQVRALKRVNIDLERQATEDPLTRLLNRRAASSRFAVVHSSLSRTRRPPTAEQPDRRRPDTIAGLMIDIDHFKQVNDLFGHPAGDRVLIAVADIIRETVLARRPNDIVSRWGGEEFLVILPRTNADQAFQRAVALVNACANALILTDRPVTLSIGVAEIEVQEYETPDQALSRLTKLADQALYRAKKPDPEGQGNHQGRNRVIRSQS